MCCRHREANLFLAHSFPFLSRLPIPFPVAQKLQISGVHKGGFLCLHPPPHSESLSHSAGAILNISPRTPLSLKARSPARVEMEVKPRRVKFLDVFICFLSSHLLMSLSPKRDPSCEQKHAGPDKTGGQWQTLGIRYAPSPIPATGEGRKPPGLSSPSFEHPWATKGP